MCGIGDLWHGVARFGDGPVEHFGRDGDLGDLAHVVKESYALHGFGRGQLRD